MKTYKQLLSLIFESYLDDLKSSKKFSNISPNTIEHYYNNATSDKNKKDTEWILQQHSKGNIEPEMAFHVRNVLNEFHKNKHRLPVEHRDLNNHSDLSSIQDSVAKLGNEQVEQGFQRRVESAPEEIKKDTETVHNGNGLKVQRIDSQKAGCHFGSGTKWCVSARNEGNMFSDYNSHGNFYIAYGKDEKGKPHRYGIHFEGHEGDGSNPEFKDEQNNQIDPYKLVKMNPELRNVKAFQFKHPAFTSNANAMKLDQANYQISKNPSEVDSILSNEKEDGNFKSEIFKYNKHSADRDVLEKIATNQKEDKDFRANILRSGKVPYDAYSVAIDPTEHPRVRVAALHENNRIHPDDLKTILENPKDHQAVRVAAIKNNTYENAATIHKIIDDKNEDNVVRANAMARHDSIDELPLRVAHRIINDKTDDPTVRALAVRQFSGFVPEKILHNIIGDKNDDVNVRHEALWVGKKNFSPKTAHDVINDETDDPNIRLRLMSHFGGSFVQEHGGKKFQNHLTNILSHPKFSGGNVGEFSDNQLLTSDHINQIMKHPKVDQFIKNKFKTHPNYIPET